MAEQTALENMLTVHRKERKDLIAHTQKLKHGVPRGDKKKKKEVNTEIAELLASLELKHEQEIKEFQLKQETESDSTLDTVDQTNLHTEGSVEEFVPNGSVHLEDGDGSVQDSHIVPKLSKAKKRRNKKAILQKERNAAIAAQELENLSGLRHIESEGIKKKLVERELTIHEVPSDGNCLYQAVEHQLSSLNLQKTNVQTLRELTSKYMLSHMEEFIPFLINPETGDVLSEEQYVKYCEDIVSSATWGGHTEIQALSHVFDVPIEIIQAEGPSIFAGNETCNPKLILSYHRHFYGLGEHYNSVVPASG